MLPAIRQVTLNPFIRRGKPQPVLTDMTPLTGLLSQIQRVELTQARRTANEPLFNGLMEQHHHLGYEKPVGEYLKNALFYRTLHGAEMDDLFIHESDHTCQLCGANSFDYLTELAAARTGTGNQASEVDARGTTARTSNRPTLSERDPDRIAVRREHG